MLSNAIASSPQLEVVGTAPSGRIALDKLDAVNPDIVTLDVEMPDLDGIETLRAIRSRRPNLPVVMCSALTERGGAVTLEALSSGATDYITKPTSTSPGGLEAFQATVTSKLCTLALARQRRPGTLGATAALAPASARASAVLRSDLRPTSLGARRPVEAIAIGVSTGGPNALAELIPALPAALSVPIFIVQHMPPLFTRLLAERLAANAPFKVIEGADAAPVRGGCAYIAPGDLHMTVSADRQRIALVNDPPENSCRPAVDVLFRSVAAAYGSGVLAVILTGMGQDGLVGCRHVHAAGGHIIAQDEASSVVWGMPGFVVNAGLADQVLPLSQIAGAIGGRLRRAEMETAKLKEMR